MRAGLTVGLHRYSAGQKNSYGIPVASWTPALDQPGEPVQVYGWAPKGETEREGPGPVSMVVSDVELYVPADVEVNPEDLVDLPEGQFEVIGHPLDYSKGPFGSALGKVVKLKKWE